MNQNRASVHISYNTVWNVVLKIQLYFKSGVTLKIKKKKIQIPAKER